MRNTQTNKKISLIILTSLSFISLDLMAQSSMPAGDKPINYLEILLIITAIVFVFVIWILSQVLVTLSRSILKKNQGNRLTKSLMLILLSSVLSSIAQSQSTTIATELPRINNYGGLSEMNFYALATVIGLELIVILFLSFMVKRAFRELTGQADAALATIRKPLKITALWNKMDKNWMTKAVPLEEEADILLDHDYDGIKELDNALPPWWKYGFYITIVIAVIYIFNFHVWGIGKNPEQEYAEEMMEGKRIEELYKAKTKDLVDENNVVISDAAGIETGKILYTQSCVACHGTKGEGGIGPNLTDEFWIHGGAMNNIYNTLKIGYPEKGMQSWQTMFSPVQLKNLASYVKSIKGTNPPNGKAPQGIIFSDEKKATTDSTSTKTGVTPQ
jgi:cytochrome c oxidase cbb3-type subunit 3